MKKELLGGPLLGKRGFYHEGDKSNSSAKHQPKRFEPIITPLVGVSNNPATSPNTKPEQFILLPQDYFIQVLAFKTGNFVANLVPYPLMGDDSNNSITEKTGKIESVCLACYPAIPRNNAIDIFDQIQSTDNENEQKKAAKKRRKEAGDEGILDHVVLVGCNDGTLREFSLLVLLASSFRSTEDQLNSRSCGPWNLRGPCYGPRRSFKITNKPSLLRHLIAPSTSSALLTRTDYGLVAYALVQYRQKKKSSSDDNDGKPMNVCNLVRLILPPYFADSMMMKSEGRIIPLFGNKPQSGSAKNSRTKTIGSLACERDEPFFCLQSVIRDDTQGIVSPNQVQFLQQQKNVYIILGRSTSIHVFSERLADVGFGLEQTKKDVLYVEPAAYNYDGSNKFCSLAVSINKNDIAIGCEKGDILILSNFLAQVEVYHHHSRSSSAKQGIAAAAVDQPFKDVVEARVHWHAHPVATLCYDANSSPTDPILYSGSDESVLVTWQPSRGISRPADVLPRLARRGISHISCSKRPLDGHSDTSSNDTILVFCEDNTLQLFETHNKRLLWKVQGLAIMNDSDMVSGDIAPDDLRSSLVAQDNPTVVIDPISSENPLTQLLFNGLPDSPGLVHWYDVAKQRVASSLEIAPYNRVSGIDQKDEIPMPAPRVSHLALSRFGRDLMTIEKVPTENRFVGATEANDMDGGDSFGYVSTVKFWVWNSSGIQGKGNEFQKPYQLVAAMARPHGAENKVSAIAMSSDGRFACTVSNDERAFRLWQKVSPAGHGKGDEDSSSRRLPVWSCQYKVTTPSGFSNYSTGRYAVAFSPDSSILVICYGHLVTLWDRFNMTLLTSYQHFDDEMIDYVEFLKNDMILCKSPSGASVKSPFSTSSLMDGGWCWSILDKVTSVYVSCARYVASHEVVAVSIYYGHTNTSRIIVINAQTGEPIGNGEVGGAIIEQVPGLVCSIVGQNVEGWKQQSNWHDESNDSSKSPPPLVLYAVTREGLLISLKEGPATKEDPALESQQISADLPATTAPRLPGTSGSEESPRKRRRIAPTSAPRFHDKKLSMVNFGNTLEDDGNAVPLPTSELPLLSGGFARAFLGRNLSRKRN